MKKKELLQTLSEIGDNEEIAVPIIWTKHDAEQVFDVVLTDSEWSNVVDNFVSGDDYDGVAMESALENYYRADK